MYKIDNIEVTFYSPKFGHYYVICNGELVFEKDHESIGRDYKRYRNCGKRYLDWNSKDEFNYVNKIKA